MHIYPALRAQMGSREYYICKMSMKTLVKDVKLASEMYESKTLDDAIQRSLEASNAKGQIVEYLAGDEDRLFSSIVVASIGGNPVFFPIEISDDPKYSVLKTKTLDDVFGVLRFDGSQTYFALDGQHRLKSIKTLLEQQEKGVPEQPHGFPEEEVSVLMLVPDVDDEEDEDEDEDEDDDDSIPRDELIRRYRRVFSALNRHAKPTDADTNIIMDEDDYVAILTRRLLTEHEFFSWNGKPNTSPILKTKGKSLRSGEPHFTTLQTLYAVNECLLGVRDYTGKFAPKAYKQVRPSEDDLDAQFAELQVYWNGLLRAIPVLRSDPVGMREHDADKPESQDHLLFWPIGTELFARVACDVMIDKLPKGSFDEADVVRCLSPFDQVDWSLHGAPWRGLLLVMSGGTWKMRSEDRKAALEVARLILTRMVAPDRIPTASMEAIKDDWMGLLIPQLTVDEAERVWSSVAQMR